MNGYRKIERIEVSVMSGTHWKEIAFSELVENDIFRITDLDNNGKIAIDGEDGKRIFIAASNPYSKDGTLIVETEEYEGALKS